jgi:hypothetical protein
MSADGTSRHFAAVLKFRGYRRGSGMRERRRRITPTRLTQRRHLLPIFSATLQGSLQVFSDAA